HQFANVEEAGDWGWIEAIDIFDAAAGIGISRLLRQAAAERMADGNELRRTAAVALETVYDLRDVILHLGILIELRDQAVEPAEIRDPIAEVAFIRTAESDHDLAAIILAVHPPPDVEFQPADWRAMGLQ